MTLFWFKKSDDNNITAVKDFISACKPVQDLPFQNGEEDWKAFYAARERMDARGISPRDIRYASLFDKLRGTPIYAALILPAPKSELSNVFNTARFSNNRDRLDHRLMVANAVYSKEVLAALLGHESPVECSTAYRCF